MARCLRRCGPCFDDSLPLPGLPARREMPQSLQCPGLQQRGHWQFPLGRVGHSNCPGRVVTCISGESHADPPSHRH